MSDDLFEAFGGDDLFEEEDEELTEAPEGEGQNRTFLIAAGILGGLLLCALIFFAIWALVLNPRMQASRQQVAQVTATAPAETAEPTAEEAVEATPTEEPTDTPEPSPTATPTEVIGPTSTPTPEAGEGEGEGEGEGAGEGAPGDATATPTREPRRTATPTRTPRPRPTPTRSGGTAGAGTDRPPDTGLGELSLVAGAMLLVGLFFVARRLRKGSV
jgi:cytoskeletal protein RodZ